MEGTAVKLRFEVGLGGSHSHSNGAPVNLPTYNAQIPSAGDQHQPHRLLFTAT
jgi:hypothetical protein